MGLTIYSPNHNIDMGAFGFARLRRKVASFCNVEISDFYEELFNPDNPMSNWKKEEWDEYDKRLNDIWYRNKKSYGKVLNFLYQSDVEGKISYGACKQILKIIGDYNSDDIYGYAGWGDHAAKFSDFKLILEDCANTKKSMKWN